MATASHSKTDSLTWLGLSYEDDSKGIVVHSEGILRACWNRETGTVQVRVLFGAWRFDSSRPHKQGNMSDPSLTVVA